MKQLFLIFTILALLSSCTYNKTEYKNEKPITLYKTWVLDSALIFPVIIPSFCDSLYKGALFTFTKDHQFIVYNRGDTCGKYHYDFDSLTHTIKINEFDMIFEFDSVNFTGDKLTFKDNATKFPNHTASQHLFIINLGNRLYLKSNE